MADVDVDMNVAEPKAKTKSLPRSERDKVCKECPERSPVKVFEKDKNTFKEKIVKFRGVPSKSQTFEKSNNKRQASRKGFYDSFAREMIKLKTVTNDDVSVSIQKWKGDLKKNKNKPDDPPIVSFSTTKTDLLPTSTPQTPTGSPPLPQPLLASSSPSAGRGHRRVATARTLAVKKSSICKYCLHKYNENDEYGDPWTACMAWTKKKRSGVARRCDVWVHTSCTGWVARSSEEVRLMPDWYCTKHRGEVMPLRVTTSTPSSTKKRAKKVKSAKKVLQESAKKAKSVKKVKKVGKTK